MPADWSLLSKELRLWAAAGLTPRLWLRDDDAVAPSQELDRLLSLCERYEVPSVLAVIPEPSGEALAHRLKDCELARIAVHGWRHANHALPGEKKQELGSHRPIPDILSELSRGLSKLATLHEGRLLPMLVPPWNRIDPLLLSSLPDIGFRLVSAFSESLVAAVPDNLIVVNTHLDIMDWSARNGRDHASLVVDLMGELRKSRDSNRHPIGVLTHHRVHDETAWSFLGQLFEMTALGDGFQWLPGDDLLQAPRHHLRA
jgi:hypothetical protein